MASEEFDSYAEQFEGIREDLKRAVATLSSGPADGSAAAREAYRRDAAQAKRLVRDAEGTVQAMELEARSVAPSEKRRLTGRIRTYRAELSAARTDLERAQTRGDRDALMAGGSRDAVSRESASQRGRIEEATARMDRSTAVLEETRRTVMETEEVGVGIMGNLHSQRETLLRAHDKVKETNRLTTRARRVLNNIKRRACYNQALLWVVILFLLGAIGAVVYFFFIASSNDNKKQ
uniref:Vesicle transport v-SNARE N-terminal domain-containing protein n=1 Tax=Bicosoecida sp. CB-2014 TaxID=1486930 RepID=A0A7S1C7L7_9STRA